MLIAVQIVFSYRPQQFWAHCPVAHLGKAEHIGSCLAHRFTSTHIPKKKNVVFLPQQNNIVTSHYSGLHLNLK